MESMGISEADSNQLYREEALQPRKNIDINFTRPYLKYSVSVTAKVDKYLKLEIRGYNPSQSKPNVNAELAIVK